MQTILGAGGAIGQPLAKELKKYTDKIRLVSRNPSKINDDDELFSADLTNAQQTEKAVKGSEVVYLTIGMPYSAKTWQEKWPVIMQNVLNATKKHNCKLVFFDNMYMYDKNSIKHMTEETPVNPPSKKGTVRAEVAGMLLNAIQKSEVEALIARAPDFIGRHNSMIGQTVIDNLQKGKKAMWIGSDIKSRNVITPIDAAKATAILGNTPDAYGQVWHLPSTKESLTGKEWIELIAQKLNAKPKYTLIKPFMFPVLGAVMPLMKEIGEMLYQYTDDYYFDSTKFEQRFDYKPLSASEAVELAISEKQLN